MDLATKIFFLVLMFVCILAYIHKILEYDRTHYVFHGIWALNFLILVVGIMVLLT